MRGIFASGVLETFLERGFQPFDFAIGVSAGACILASHLAGQPSRNHRVYTQYMTQPGFRGSFVRRRSAARCGKLITPIVRLQWLWPNADR